VFVYQLRVAVTAQQDRKIIEPRYDALQFDAVDQKHGHGRFVFTNVIEENVLNVL
jgi:hypothetical protein